MENANLQGPTRIGYGHLRVWFFDTYLKGQALQFPTNSEIYNVNTKGGGGIANEAALLNRTTDYGWRPRWAPYTSNPTCGLAVLRRVQKPFRAYRLAFP